MENSGPIARITQIRRSNVFFSDPKEDLLNIFVLQKKVMELLDLELIPKNRKAVALQIIGGFTQLIFLLNTEGDWMGLQLGANYKIHDCVQAVILNSLTCFLYAMAMGYNLAQPKKHFGWPVSVNGHELPTLKQLPFPEYIVATACLLIKQANQAMMGRGNALDRGKGLHRITLDKVPPSARINSSGRCRAKLSPPGQTASSLELSSPPTSGAVIVAY
jgi:hypothetical protein